MLGGMMIPRVDEAIVTRELREGACDPGEDRQIIPGVVQRIDAARFQVLLEAMMVLAGSWMLWSGLHFG